VNRTPEKVLPVRSWMMPASSCVRPPNISATANTTGFTAGEMRFALVMLSMKVVTPKAANASGAELPQLRVVRLWGRPSRSASCRSDRVGADRGRAGRVGADRVGAERLP
jgi:hypothetical protein